MSSWVGNWLSAKTITGTPATRSSLKGNQYSVDSVTNKNVYQKIYIPTYISSEQKFSSQFYMQFHHFFSFTVFPCSDDCILI